MHRNHFGMYIKTHGSVRFNINKHFLLSSLNYAQKKDATTIAPFIRKFTFTIQNPQSKPKL